MARDKEREFSEKTKKILAERAGYICSNPDCLALTIGADGEGVLKIGDAAHINAVGKDWPRFDETLPNEYIKSEANGIWLCKICHKKVDNKKTKKYTAELLKQWKESRETSAEFEVGKPRSQTTNINEDNKVIIKKLENIEKTIKRTDDNRKEKIDNYGLAKEVTDQFKEIDTCLIKRILYGEKKYKSKTSINANMIEIFEWVIGNRSFPLEEIKNLYKNSDDSLLDGNLDIIKIKRKAFIDYFDDEIEKSQKKYNILYRKLNDIKEKWIRDDILIDGRNILYKIEFLQNKRILKNKFENKIRQNGYNIQYPYIDRLEKELLNNSIDRTNNYKYKRNGTQIFGVGLEYIFLDIQKIIYISILYGSITQILCLRKTIGMVLLLYADSLKYEELYKIALKFYVLSGEYEEFKKIVDKVSLRYRSLESDVYLKEILKLRPSILKYNIEYFDIFIFDYYGRLLNETQYEKYENRILKILNGNKNMLINSSIKAIPSNISRFKSLGKLFTIFDNKLESLGYRREIQTVLNYVSYKDLSADNKLIIKEIIKKIIESKDYLIITGLLIEIKKEEGVKDYDEILLKEDSDDNLLFKINETDEYKPEYLDLIINEITKRHKKTIETKVITGYSTTYNIVSGFFESEKEKLKVKKIIEEKIFPLINMSISSSSIEIIEKLKLLRTLLYIHFFNSNYDSTIKEILNSMSLDGEDTAFSTHYSSDYLILYVELFKCIFNEITLDELLNYYLLEIIEKAYLFSEIRLIVEYIFSKLKFSTSNLNIICIIIHLMLNSTEEDRVNAIKLSKVLYKSKYFDSIYEELITISKDSRYNEMKAVVILIKELNDNSNIQIKELINNIIYNNNYNIRYIGTKYLGN